MNSLFLVVITLVLFFASYLTYGRFLSRRLFALDPKRKTPAVQLNDGFDYVPSRKEVLFGHHFASIAGLGPVMGPAIAVIWGWLPALLWVILGSIFIGGVHDLASLTVSLRHQGRSIGDVSRQLIGKRAWILFLLIIYFLLSLAMGVFVYIIAVLFTVGEGGERMYPEAVIPIVSLMGIAVVVGYLIYRRGMKILTATLIGLLLTLFFLFVGINHPLLFISGGSWVFILLGYAFLASVLPVWLLLQPRDYLNSFLLYLGLILILLGVFIAHPTVSAPAVNLAPGLPPIFPLLFITVACGAVSGFHSLVASGTTSKQLASETEALTIGYGGMLTEGVLAMLVIVSCVSGLSRSYWQVHYASFAQANALGPKLKAFITGASNIISSLGIPSSLISTLLAVMVVSFALTTLDSATRLLRYTIEELGRGIGVRPLTNRYLSSLVAVFSIAYFALLKVGGRPAGLVLWQLFGTSNQLLAGLALLTVFIFLARRGKPGTPVLIPMLFMMAITLWAMVNQLIGFAYKGEVVLLVVSLIILILAFWLIAEAIFAIIKMRWNNFFPRGYDV
jgi:carbon starvation protein